MADAPSRKPFLRRLLIGVGVVVLLLMTAVGGGAWWLGTEAGLQFAVARLQKAMADAGNVLTLDGTSGSLYRGIRIARFDWQGGGLQASGQGLVLQWSPAALLQRRIVVDELMADKLDVRLPPPQPDSAPRGPTAMPPSFALPVSFELQRLAVSELRVTPGAAPGAPPPEPIVLNDIGAKLAYSDALFRLEQFGVRTPFGRLTDTRIEVADAPPHRVRAQADWKGDVEKIAYALRLEANGDLDRLQARTRGRVAEADVRLDATLAPLATMPLATARLEIAGLDLKRLAQSAPGSRIDATLDLNGEDEGRRWTGQLDLRNAAAGGLAAGGIPVTGLKSRLALLNADDPAARQLQLRDLLLTLPGASTEAVIDGWIDVYPGRELKLAGTAVPEVEARLGFKAIDLAQFAAQLPPTALDGSLDLQRNDFALLLSQSEERVRAALPAALKAAAGPAEVAVRGRLEEAALRLDEARVRLGQTRLQAQGTAGLAAPHRVSLKGEARRLDLKQWLPKSVDGRWRQGLISGDWSIDGKVAQGFDAWLTMTLVGSTLAGRPLGAEAKSRLVLAADGSPVRVEKTAVDVRFGGNRIRANGSLGNAADRMVIDAAAPEPELLDQRLRGRITVAGELTGAFERLRAKVTVAGDRLSVTQENETTRLGSIRIDASGPVTAAVPPQAPIDVAVRLRALEAAGRKVESLDINVNGTLAAHRFNLAAVAEGQSARLAGDGQAALGAAPSWTATLATTTLDGSVTMRLTAPASLRVDARSARIERFRIGVVGGEATLDRLAFEWGAAPTFNTRGSARDLPISRLLALAGTDSNADSLRPLQSLRLDGEWNLAGTGAEDLSGDARLALREVQARTAGTALGLTGDNGVRVALKQGRLDGRFDLNLPSLAFTHPLTGPDLMVDGRLRVGGTVAGTLAQPLWNATLTGESLSVLQRSVGWRLGDGVLSARFEGRQFQLQRLSFNAGEGSVSLKGQAALLDAPRSAGATGSAGSTASPEALTAAKGSNAAKAGNTAAPSTLPFDGRFDLTVSTFPVPIGPGQRVALSGTTTLASGKDGLSLRGKLTADHGIIEIQGSSAPSLPADVKLVYADADGKTVRPPDAAGQAAAPPAKDGKAGSAKADDRKSAIRILTDLGVDLGERLRVTGNGVAARLTGNLQVLGTLPDEPRLAGVITLVEGSYQSYGQNLRIDKGIVRFNGPIDNPALDITAKRPFLPVEVGVSITGTALNPVITLVSKPEMSETDKLSWLVLGTDPTNAPSAAQSLALREAARTLLVNDDGRYKPGIAERLGLDVMNFGYGSDTGQTQAITESKNPTGLPGSQSTSATAAQQQVVTLGKRIGSKLFVSYEQGVRGLYNLLRIQYTLSQRLSVRAQSGSDNSLDLLYSYSFD